MPIFILSTLALLTMAVSALGQSNPLQNKTTADDSQQMLIKAQVHFERGSYFSDQPGGSDSALFHFEQAFRIRKKYLIGPDERIAQCYSGFGDVYKYMTYEYELAAKNYEASLKIREELIPKDTLNLANNYYNLATTYRSQQDFDKAIAYGNTTVELAKRIKNYALLQQTYTVLGNIHRDKQESEQARKFYKNSLELNFSTGQSVLTRAWNYVGIGQTCLNDSLWDDAIQNFNKAIPIFVKLENAGPVTEDTRNLWIYTQLKLAMAYLLKGDLVRAKRAFRDHFSTLSRMHIVTGKIVAEALTGYGIYCYSINQYDSAIRYYQLALQQALPSFHPLNSYVNPDEEIIGNNFYVYEILSRKAKVFRYWYEQSGDRKHLFQALEGFKLAERMMSQQRNTLDMTESKWQFLDAHFNLYEELLWCWYQLYHDHPDQEVLQQVFTCFESSKARTLNDVLVEGLSNPVVRQQNKFNRSWFSIKYALKMEQGKAQPDSNVVLSLNQQLIELDRDRKRNEEEVEKQYPGYYKVRMGPVSTTLREVQQFVQQDNHVVLEYFFGEESVYAMGISGHAMTFKRLGSADSIRVLVNNLLMHFEDGHSSLNKDAYIRFVRSSHGLYQYLVKPFEDILEGMKNVQVIPDGLISQVPFEVLLSEQPSLHDVNYWRLQYAVRSFSFGYAYSASLMVSNQSRSISNPSLLAMGFGAGKDSTSGRKLADLGGSLLELDILKKYFGGGKFLIGSEASKENFKVLSPEYDIIHLAIHGKGDRENQFSSSLFFRSPNDTLVDGQLHAFELYGMQLKATLAVLTACESGLGKTYRGEGMMSIATAFSYSGCQNTVMSLWKVNDQTSVGLMSVFYKHLLEGERIDDALTMAKRNYLEQADEITADPKIWAPMVAYGSLNSVIAKDKRSTLISTVCFTVVVLLLVFIGRGLFKLVASRRS